MMEVRMIPTHLIHEPPVVLRVVNRRSIEYEEMKDSIEEIGFINSLCARPAPHRGEDHHEIVDGLYRLNCCRDLKIPEVPCIVREVSDQMLLRLQIQANAIRPETTRIEFARQIQKIIDSDESLTLPDIAAMVHKSPGWVQRTLELMHLEPALQRKVDRGEICLGNAYWLARMNRSYRPAYIEHAENMTAKEFRALALSRIKAFKEAIRQGDLTAFYAKRYTPYPHLRSLIHVEHERKKLEAATKLIPMTKCLTPLDGWRMALAWVVHMDPDTAALLQEYNANRQASIADRQKKRRASIVKARNRRDLENPS